MDDIFGLKFYLSFRYTDNTKIFLWNPFNAQIKVIFVTEFAICKNAPFYEVNQSVWKWLCVWRDFKKIFPRPLFTIIFRQKILISCTYSVLSRLWWWLLNFSFVDIIHWLWSGHILLLNRIYFAFLLLSDPFLLEPRICCCE